MPSRHTFYLCFYLSAFSSQNPWIDGSRYVTNCWGCYFYIPSLDFHSAPYFRRDKKMPQTCQKMRQWPHLLSWPDQTVWDRETRIFTCAQTTFRYKICRLFLTQFIDSVAYCCRQLISRADSHLHWLQWEETSTLKLVFLKWVGLFVGHPSNKINKVWQQISRRGVVRMGQNFAGS